MLLDLLLVLVYLAAVMLLALRSSKDQSDSVEEFFLSSRRLRWPSIAVSTIATNISGFQFLGMMGSAYLYGLAQANLEINAVQGLLLAAFVFVPMYLRNRVVTVTQFIKTRLGPWVAGVYSVGNILLFSTIGLGAALFWGGYAADFVLGDYLNVLTENRLLRIGGLVVFFGIFSAIYTYFGGLSAVVRTDIIQFAILLVGAIILLFVSVDALGGWGKLYEEPLREKMHLHLPQEHPKLPWIAIGGWFLLNINYWCANQSVVQRSLAARSLRDAQIGLLAGGVMKYFMAVLIVVPGIALVGILGEQGLSDPDEAFPYLVRNYLPTGLRGLILCALFASLMSTVDSLYNSLATLFSIDIYKSYIKKEATDREMVRAGRLTILVTMVTGILMGLYLLNSKFSDQGQAFTHYLNELRYYVNSGIVVVILGAALLLAPNRWAALIAFVGTVPANFALQYFYPDMNYFVRAMWVIVLAFSVMYAGAYKGFFTKDRSDVIGFRRGLLEAADRQLAWLGVALLVSLGLLHLIFS